MLLEIRAPVDADFLRRAAKADLKFASTGKVTVHKFAAGHRYLSYSQQDATKQNAILTQFADANHPDLIAAVVAHARRLNTFMCVRHPSYDSYAPGDLARQNAARKGPLMPETIPLGSGAVLHHRFTHSALDWKDRPKRGVLWTNQNPYPRILLPYTGGSRVALKFSMFHTDRAAGTRHSIFLQWCVRAGRSGNVAAKCQILACYMPHGD